MTDPGKRHDGAHSYDADSGTGDSDKDVAKEQAAGVASDAKDRGREVAGQAQQQAGQVVGEAQAKAGQVAGEAQAKAGQVAGEAQTHVKEVAGEAQAHAKDLFSQARSEVYDTAGQQQQYLAKSLHGLGDEFGAMVSGSRESDVNSGTATRIGEMASERISEFADWLERREPSDVLDEVTRYARRNPGTFMIGAAVIGLVAGRITRSLTDDKRDDNSGDDNSSGERRTSRRTDYGRGGYGHRTTSDYTTHNVQSQAPSSYYPDAYEGQGSNYQGRQVQGSAGELSGTAAERTPVAGDDPQERYRNANSPEQPGNTYPSSGRGQ